MATDPIITFNVGGQLHSTFRSTIMKYPNTMLGKVLGGDPGAIPLVKDANGHYFIDRSPIEFDQVLTYYREGIAPTSHSIRLYWGFGDPDLLTTEATVLKQRDNAFALFDTRYEVAKVWVRKMLACVTASESTTSFFPLIHVIVTTPDQLKMSPEWLASLTEREQLDLSAMFALDDCKKLDTDPISVLWNRRVRASTLTEFQMTMVSAILSQLGCKDIGWNFERANWCLCGLSKPGTQSNSDTETRDRLILKDLDRCFRLSSVTENPVAKKRISVPLCRRIINHKIRGGHPMNSSCLPECPDDERPIRYTLTFKFMTVDDYRTRIA